MPEPTTYDEVEREADATRIYEGYDRRAAQEQLLEQGLPVHPSRGVVPDRVIDAYEAAHAAP